MSQQHLQLQNSNSDLKSPGHHVASHPSLEEQSTVVRNYPETAIRAGGQLSEDESEEEEQYESSQRREEQMTDEDQKEERIDKIQIQFGNEYGEAGNTMQGEQYESSYVNRANRNSFQNSRQSYQEIQNSHQSNHEDRLLLGNMVSSSNGKETNLSSNIYRGESESRPVVDRIVPYQRDSNSSGSRRGLDVGPLFTGKDLESDSNQLANFQNQALEESGRLPYIEEDQQRTIARSGDYEIQSRRTGRQPFNNTNEFETRGANQEQFTNHITFNNERQTHHTKTEVTEHSQHNETDADHLQQQAQFIDDHQKTLHEQAQKAKRLSDQRNALQYKRNKDLDQFYNRLDDQNEELNIEQSQRNQGGLLSQGKNSTGQFTATQTTDAAPFQYQSLSRPQIIGQTSNTIIRNANQITNHSANNSNQNVLSQRLSGSRKIGSNAVNEELISNEQMKSIPYNNFISDRDTGTDQQSTYTHQNQIQEQQNQPIQPSQLERMNEMRTGGQEVQIRDDQNQLQNFIRQQMTHQSEELQDSLHQQLVHQSAELQGLDLTEEDLDEPELSMAAPNSQKKGMTVNKLSTINDYTVKDSYNLSDEHQISQIRALGNFQGNFDNLEQVEAELQAEVDQLDLIYAQHKNMNYQHMQRRDMTIQDSTEKFQENFQDFSQIQSSPDRQNVVLLNSGNPYKVPEDGAYDELEEYHDPPTNENISRSNQRQPMNYIYSDNSLSIGGFQQKMESENQNQFDPAQELEEVNDNESEQEEVVSEQQDDNNQYIINQNNPYGNMVIKSLQDQISQLSYYKQMCEQRIRYLQPGHPLPIQMEHMNQPNHAMLQQHQLQMQRLVDQHQQEKQNMQKEIDQLKRLNKLSSQTSNPPQYDMGNSFGGDGQQTDQKVRFDSTSNNQHMNSSSVEYSVQLNQQVTQMRQAFEQMKLEKNTLEKSLRQETQHNEELNMKVKILKDSLEQKFSVEYPQLKAFIVNSHQNQLHQTVPYNSTISPTSTKLESTKRSVQHVLSTRNSQLKGADGTQAQVVDYYLQISQTKAENEQMRKTIAKLNQALEKEQHMNDVHNKQEEIYQSQLNQVTNGQSLVQAEAKQKSMELEITQKSMEITFFKEQIEHLKLNNQELQEEQRKLMMSCQDVDSKTSHLVQLRLENDTKAKEIVVMAQEIENLSKKVRDQENLRESMQFSIKEGNERVGIYQSRVRDETNEICELRKLIDDQHLELNKRDQAMNRAKEEAQTTDKKSKLEIESLNNIIKQNKDYIEEQEQNIRKVIASHQSEILEQRKKFEGQNLKQMQHISELNNKIVDLDSKCFTAEFEKAQVDETFIENSNAQQNFELVQVKHKQLTERNRHLQTQHSNVQKRTSALEKKLEMNQQQIENLKTQNIWLKEERQKTIEENLATKEDLENAIQDKQDNQHQLNMFTSRDKIESQQIIQELERKTKQLNTLEQKFKDVQSQLSSAHTQKDVLETSNKHLERSFIDLQSNIQQSSRDKQLLEKQLLDIKEENEQLYRNEERVKGLISDLEAQKTQTHVMFKENQYNESKVKKCQGELDHLESELRMLRRDRSELEEQVIQLKNKQKQSNEQILGQIGESTKLKSELDNHMSKNSNFASQAKMDSYKVEELHSKIEHLEAYNEDLRSQLSRNIGKNNENCLKFEQETKLVDGIRMIQMNSMNALITPFLQSISDQVETSDILKEALFNSDPQNKSFELFKGQIKRFITVKEDQDVLQIQRQTAFEYCKFLHQDLIEKLIAAVIDGRSDNILQSKKNHHLTLKLNQDVQGNQQNKNLITRLQEHISVLEQQASDNETEYKRSKNELATCRQKIKSLEDEVENLKIVSKEKDKEMVNIIKEKENRQNNFQDQSQEQDQVAVEQLEKKHLWKALKCLKGFLKSDQSFAGLLAMLNEYIILLEQLIFDKKQNQKRLENLTQRTWQTQQKLKVVENDMKCFRVNQNEFVNTSYDSKKSQVGPRCNSFTQYQSQASKAMKSMRLPLESSNNFSTLLQTQNSNHNQLGMRLNYQTQGGQEARPPKPLSFQPSGTQNYQTNQKI